MWLSATSHGIAVNNIGLGNLKYEMEKKEYTFSKNVMLIDNQTETGRTWIKEYIERFEDTKKNYETSVMQYYDTES